MPHLYVGIISFLLAVTSAAWRYAWTGPQPWWLSRGAFAFLLIVALVCFQYDALRANFQLWNPDESQLIAGALVLQERPIFWRDVDVGSSGPLNVFPVLLPALFGLRIDYISIRIVATLLTILELVLLQSALRARLTEGSARLVALPAWAFFVFNQDPEIAQYTTELVPNLLLIAAVVLLAGIHRHPDRSAWWYWSLGALCGAAPFGKLQAAPLAAWVIATALFIAWRNNHGLSIKRSRCISALGLGVLAPGCVLMGTAVVAGAGEDFFVRYIETNLAGYVAEGASYFNDALPSPYSIFGLPQFLWPVIIAVISGFVAGRKNRHWGTLLFSLGWVVAAAIAIYAPRKPFGHYFLFLICPLILLLGATLGMVLDRVSAKYRTSSRALAAALLAVMLAGASAAHRFQHPDYLRGVLRSRPAVPREIIEALQRHLSPGEILAVWGWQPALYVFTQTVAATQDTVIFWQTVPSSRREFFRSRYLEDFHAHPPKVFIDTMGPADFFFFRNDSHRHESFPKLQALIEHDYQLVESVGRTRIYLRHNRD